MELFYKSELTEHSTETELIGSEAKHIQRVLRKNKGDMIYLTNGLGYLYKCIIIESDKKGLQLHVEDFSFFQRPKPEIHLYLGKMHHQERLEFAAEKCTELGVQSISIVETEHTQPFGKMKYGRVEQKIIGALKQSQNLYLPKLNFIDSLSAALLKIQNNQRFLNLIAHEINLEKAERKTLIHFLENCEQNFDKVNLFIGPEGGFSTREVESALLSDCQLVSLGEKRLRAETAAILAVGAFALHT